MPAGECAARARGHVVDMHRSFDLSRAAGLSRLAEFLPRSGRAYAATRNLDAGPQRQASTSALSPYLRRRLILEHEVVRAAQDAHGTGASKYVDEVFWRSYFKGHLETRPAIWSRYRALVEADRAGMGRNGGLRSAYEAAIGSRTGIACFDDWARELVDTNWLHNHTRMWFASIWIFTLGLPWALGADFFLRHLLDGDPASNTLSWRWVAGLHTRGKAYAARSENIRRYTEGRYAPDGLNENPVALREDDDVAPMPLPAADAAGEGDAALLLHLDDLHPESLPLGGLRIVRVGGLIASSPDAADAVCAADRAAMADALARAAAHFGCEATLVSDGWAGSLPVVAAWAPVGPSAAALPACRRVRRTWDERSWPRSTRGFFQLRAAIPSMVGDPTA